MRERLRWLYVRVLAVQALTLVALWLLQAAFGLGAGPGAGAGGGPGGG